MSATPFTWTYCFDPDPVQAAILSSPQDWKTLGYYGFPGFTPPDPDPAPDQHKPATTIDILKHHETVVEKALDSMTEIERMIIYRTLNAQGKRMDGIDRDILKEAQKELKGNK